MLLPCDSWGRKDNSEKTLKNCNFSLRLRAHPLRAPAGNPRAGTGRGAHWVEVGHRYRADWGSRSESEAGPRLPDGTGHSRWRGAETVCPDSPGRSGAKEDPRALTTSARLQGSRCGATAWGARRGRAGGRGSCGGEWGGGARRRWLFDRRPENVDQPSSSHAAPHPAAPAPSRAEPRLICVHTPLGDTEPCPQPRNRP